MSINKPNIDFYNLDSSEKKHVFLHELGHALGLDHSCSGNVMQKGEDETSSVIQLGNQDKKDYDYLWD